MNTSVPFESPVLTAASMKPIAFWDITPCSFFEVDRRFRIRRPDDGGSTSETSVYSTRLHGAISQKAVTFTSIPYIMGNMLNNSVRVRFSKLILLYCVSLSYLSFAVNAAGARCYPTIRFQSTVTWQSQQHTHTHAHTNYIACLYSIQLDAVCSGITGAAR
jgi:hypothetical protein